VRLTKNAAIALAAILEYITYAILELSMNCCRDHDILIIRPRHFALVVLNDEELATTFCKCTLSYGSVYPPSITSITSEFCYSNLEADFFVSSYELVDLQTKKLKSKRIKRAMSLINLDEFVLSRKKITLNLLYEAQNISGVEVLFSEDAINFI